MRLLIGDTDDANYLFTDAEVTAFLANASNSPHRAAAMAVRAIAADRAKLSKKIEREGYKSEAFALDELRKLAESLDEQAISGGGLQVGMIDGGDTVFDSYRPGFRSVDEIVLGQ